MFAVYQPTAFFTNQMEIFWTKNFLNLLKKLFFFVSTAGLNIFLDCLKILTFCNQLYFAQISKQNYVSHLLGWVFLFSTLLLFTTDFLSSHPTQPIPHSPSSPQPLKKSFLTERSTQILRPNMTANDFLKKECWFSLNLFTRS